MCVAAHLGVCEGRMCSNVTAALVMIPPPVFTLHTLHRSSNVGGHQAAPLKLSPNGYHIRRFWHTVYTTLRGPSVYDLARLHTCTGAYYYMYYLLRDVYIRCNIGVNEAGESSSSSPLLTYYIFTTTQTYFYIKIKVNFWLPILAKNP